MMNKYFKLLVAIGALLVLSIATVASFAFYVAFVRGNESAYENVITTGEMALMLNDSESIALENAVPGSSVTKTFKVKNIGTMESVYNIYLSELLNEFADKNDLVYTLSSGNGCSSSENVIPNEVGEESKITSGCAINAGEEHEYTLTIMFKDDNTNQDDNKNKIFSAKISINEYKEYPGIAYYLKNIKNNGATDLEYDGISILGENGTVDNNLRYIGANPKNYVEFNGELWRIVGLFNNVEDESGNKSSYVKIVRNSSLGNYSWDSSKNSINTGSGINQWGESVYEDGTYYEGADLMRELNTDYLGNVTIGTNGKWYNGVNNKKSANKPSSYIRDVSKNMIQKVKWNLGSIDRETSTTNVGMTAHNFYNFERSDNTSKICESSTYCNDTVVRTTDWIGNVGLIYFSDYGYSTVGGENVDRLTCLSNEIYNWRDGGELEFGTECSANSWLNKGLWYWTFPPIAFTGNPSESFGVGESGYLGANGGHNSKGVFPSVLLRKSVSIVSGSGTQSDPYKLVI